MVLTMVNLSEEPARVTREAEAWRDLGLLVAAHLVMLREEGILDDAAAAALHTALDGARRGAAPPVGSLSELIAAFDVRLDALAPAGTVGAAAVGRAPSELVAALTRLAAREGLLRFVVAVNDVRSALIDLAAMHAVTLMPAYHSGQAAQPTTFAHFLGGVIAPLGRAAGRLPAVYEAIDRSPLGALSLASTSLPISRERTAELLGFDGLLTNTYDAVAAVDQVALVAEAVAAVAAMIRRFLEEILTWLRTEPGSFRLGDAWRGNDAGLPQGQPSVGLDRLVLTARRIEGDAATLVRLARDAPYGPAVATLEAIDAPLRRLLTNGTVLTARTAELVATGLDPNRAYLANRAGRAHTTSSDLADFLMVEEGLEPIAARTIAALTIGKAIEQGIEVSGITSEMIDSAALLIVGRELGIEFENISRHLAPRRFVERRTTTGSPAPNATRAYLDLERQRLAADVQWRDAVVARLATARAELERLEADAVAGADG